MKTTLATFAAFLATLALLACGEIAGGVGQISQKIGETVSDPSIREIDLGKLTSFGWDRVYFFKSGTARKDICAFIRARPGQCERVIRYESVAPESMVLVFGLGGQLTHVEQHSIANGRFDLDATSEGLPRKACVFKVRREASSDGKPSIWLEPRPIASESA